VTFVPLGSHSLDCLSCADSAATENDGRFPVPPPDSESENIDPNNVVAGVPQEVIVDVGGAFQRNQGQAARCRIVHQRGIK